MTRASWGVIAGVGVAGLLLATPSARADHHEAKERSSSASEKAAGGTASEARGSGQAGASTGARPGEVTGAPEAAGGTSEKERAAAAAAQNEISGKVEKYDREKRTLSLSGSDKKLKLTDDTQVLKDGARVSPGQLMEGDEVRASYAGSGDEVEASVIEVTPGSPAGGAAAPGPSGGSETKGSSSETGSGSTGTGTKQP